MSNIYGTNPATRQRFRMSMMMLIAVLIVVAIGVYVATTKNQAPRVTNPAPQQNAGPNNVGDGSFQTH